MKRFENLVIAFVVTCGLCASADAQNPSERSTIAYRTVKPQSLHFDRPEIADKHLQMVKKLGCEASLDSHGNHTDVSYECASWRSLNVATDRLAHQWEAWLKDSGFETLHGHPVDAAHDHSHDHGAHAEEITYELRRWISRSFENESIANSSAAVLQGLGCEVKQSRQNDAFVVEFRCVRPMSLEVTSHEAAHAWQEWLNKAGFTTRHDH